MVNDFIIINDEFKSLEERGYRLIYNAYCNSDREFEMEIRNSKSTEYVSELYKEFYDGCYLPICMDAVNLLYAVLFFRKDTGEQKPLLWKEVRRFYRDKK